MPETPRPQFTSVARHYDHLMRAVPYDSWVEYVEQPVAHERAVVRRVLDLACGTGQMTQRLHARGYEVVGADCSEAMLAQARRAWDGAHRPPEFVAADARALCFSPVFDLVLCLFDSLNYITDEGGLSRCFVGVAQALRPRGLFIFDLNTIRALEQELFTQKNPNPSDPLQYNWESSYDAEARVCTVRMRFRYEGESGAEEFVEVHRQKGYTHSEIEAWLKDAGFERPRALNAYTFRRASPFANRVFYVTRKARWRR